MQKIEICRKLEQLMHTYTLSIKTPPMYAFGLTPYLQTLWMAPYPSLHKLAPQRALFVVHPEAHRNS